MKNRLMLGLFQTSNFQRCIFFYNSPPPKGGKESKALRAREGNQRRVKKKGRKGKGKEKGKGKGKKKGRKRGREENKKKIRVQKEREEEKNMRGKEMKKMDKGAGQCKRTEKRWDQSDNT